MTAEQLEELLGKVRPDWRYHVDDDDGVHVVHSGVIGPRCHIDTSNVKEYEPDMRLIALAPSLARSVIAAERMATAFEQRIRGADNATECLMSIHAYREASKGATPQ